MIREYMLDFGYTDKEIDKILKNTVVCRIYPKTLYKKIVDIVTFFQSKGYNDKQIIKMTKAHPQLFGYTIDGLQQKIDDLLRHNYEYSLIMKMTVECPQIYSLSVENIEYKMQEIMKLGYTREDLLEMIKVFPALYTFNIDNIKQKINDLKMLGYSSEQVIFITVNFPHIFSLSIENLIMKYNFYASIGIIDVMLENPKRWMQSIDLSYARYMYFKSMGINIGMNDYYKLFIDQGQFVKKYKVTNKELIELYKYDKEDIKVKNKTIK